MSKHKIGDEVLVAVQVDEVRETPDGIKYRVVRVNKPWSILYLDVQESEISENMTQYLESLAKEHHDDSKQT